VSFPTGPDYEPAPFPHSTPREAQPDPYTLVPPPHGVRVRHDRRWLPWALLAMTLVTTTLAGGCHYASFVQGFREPVLDTAGPGPGTLVEWLAAFAVGLVAAVVTAIRLALDIKFMAGGLWFSLTVLAILGCHEMGHYIACLRYGVDATRPFFLPAPLPLTGTLGAFIRIRSRIPTKTALFDIGIAGPIAGFVVAVPALFIGLALSHVEKLPADMAGMMTLGEPLLFQAVKRIVFGTIPQGYDINMHPMAFAAWFGLLATALNLFPIAQLDGGHISYAVLGRRSLWVTMTMAVVAIGLTFVSASWIAWTVMLVLMLVLVGPHHPPTLDDHTPISTGRLWLALFALVMLAICFTPAPLDPLITGQ
jgi:hypothetical protein